MSLVPAQPYREELKCKLIECWYNPKYKYYFSGSAYELSVPDNNDHRHDFVHLDKNGDVDGYFSYQIDWRAKSLYNFGLIGFADNNISFIMDCVRRLEHMIDTEEIQRLEFWAWADNPINKFYRHMVNKWGGKVAGYLTNSGFFDGRYHDSIIYEVLL